ncbi:hypothetical protein [Streptomyces sp. NPDC004134]|uniref:hypothetical protein n=1 Tax=Streptomyces sp. NPDC004134 TaxID=3364691 RepID=UPI0036C53240
MSDEADQQPTARQNFVLYEAGIEDPVAFEEDPGILAGALGEEGTGRPGAAGVSCARCR